MSMITGTGIDQDGRLEYGEADANEYLICQCNPPVVPEIGDPLPLHRIPIDCMTAEDWQRVARARQVRAATVWVVSVEGDSDCGYANDGAIGVFDNIPDAWKLATSASEDFFAGREWDTDLYYKIDDEGIHLERGSYLVKEFSVE